jgi:hypothetical protein
MSDVNNPNSWNPLNVAFIGKDDGTQITGLAAYTIAESGIAPVGSLVVFKDFETYQIIGVFGALDFAIQKAQTDLGCVAPRSIQFLPGYGIARLAHLGVAIFDGVRDRVISEEIRPYLFGGELDILPVDWTFAYLSKGTQCANPPMYMLAVPLLQTAATHESALPLPGAGVTSAPVSTLPAGTYWLFVTALQNGVEIARSPETAAIAVAAAQALGVSMVASALQNVGATSWRVYFGTAPGGENQYVESTTVGSGPPTFRPPTIEISAPGTPGVPGSFGGALSRILCYDLVLKGWVIIDLPWPIEVLKQVRAISSPPVTLTGGFNDSTVRRIQAGDPTWDGVPINFSVRTPEVFGKTANQPVFYRRLSIRGEYMHLTPQMPPFPPPNYSMNLTVNYDGVDRYQIPGQYFPIGGGNFELRLELGELRRTAHIDLSGIADIINLPVEIHEFSWEVQPRSQGPPVWI